MSPGTQTTTAAAAKGTCFLEPYIQHRSDVVRVIRAQSGHAKPAKLVTLLVKRVGVSHAESN